MFFSLPPSEYTFTKLPFLNITKPKCFITKKTWNSNLGVKIRLNDAIHLLVPFTGRIDYQLAVIAFIDNSSVYSKTAKFDMKQIIPALNSEWLPIHSSNFQKLINVPFSLSEEDTFVNIISNASKLKSTVKLTLLLHQMTNWGRKADWILEPHLFDQ
jgi:hypothetical protein